MKKTDKIAIRRSRPTVFWLLLIFIFTGGIPASGSQDKTGTAQESKKAREWVVVLKNGRIERGRIVAQRGAIIVLQTETGTMEIHVSSIKDIRLVGTESPEREKPPLPPEPIVPDRPGETERKAGGGTAPDLGRDKSIFFKINVHSLFPADGNYKEIYGNQEFSLEIAAGFRVFKHVFAWGAVNSVSAQAELSIPDVSAASNQKFISLGLTYRRNLGGKWDYRIGVGAVKVAYSEEILGESVSEEIIGFRVEGGLLYHFHKILFAGLSVGLLQASDRLNDKTVRPGGLYTALGLGIKL